MGEVIVITSGKGGVGKTTAAANIGATLAKNGRKTVIIDMDLGLRKLDIAIGIADKVVYNDINWAVRDLLEKIAHDKFVNTYQYIEKTIAKNNLEKKNKETYTAFRTKYNSIEKYYFYDMKSAL